jgi:hypothetical protein
MSVDPRGTLNRIAQITLQVMPSAAIVGMMMLGEDEQPVQPAGATT